MAVKLQEWQSLNQMLNNLRKNIFLQQFRKLPNLTYLDILKTYRYLVGVYFNGVEAAFKRF